MENIYELNKELLDEISECKDNAVIEFLKENGYRPKRTKRYFYDLNRRLENKGLRLVCEDIYNMDKYKDFRETGILQTLYNIDFNVRFEKIESKDNYKKSIKVDDEYNLYKSHTFKFNPGVTVLIGKNGSGKSTLIREIEYFLKEEKSNVFTYRNEDYEGKTHSQFVFNGNYELLAQSMSNSEGQEIKFNFGNNVGRLGDFVRKCAKNNEKEIFVLFDGLDSGLSIDGINEITSVFELIEEDSKNMDVYIIITANTYELVRGRNCLYVSNGRYMKFDNYEDYRRFILGGKKR